MLYRVLGIVWGGWGGGWGSEVENFYDFRKFLGIPEIFKDFDGRKQCQKAARMAAKSTAKRLKFAVREQYFFFFPLRGQRILSRVSYSSSKFSNGINYNV